MYQLPYDCQLELFACQRLQSETSNHAGIIIIMLYVTPFTQNLDLTNTHLTGCHIVLHSSTKHGHID